MSFRHVIVLASLLGAGSIQAQPAPQQPAPAAPAAEKSAPVAAPTAPTATPAEATAQTVATKPGDATAGLGKSATCAACHGMDGNSATSQYPKLAGQHENYIVRQVALFKNHQRDSPVMMGFAMPLGDQDMHDIGAYFASKTTTAGVADSKLVTQGELIYRGGDAKSGTPACMACHGPDGRGNPGAGYPQLAGQFADYITAKLKDWHDGKTWGDDDHAKVMPMVAKTLSDADIAAVASYIEGLHSAAASSATAAK